MIQKCGISNAPHFVHRQICLFLHIFPFYRLITDLEAHFDEKKEELVEILQTLVKMIFRPENLMVDFVGEEKAVALLDAPVEAFKAALYMENVEKEHYIPETSRKNEGFLTSGPDH